MSASSPDLGRQVSDTTQVGEDYAPGDLNPTEKVFVRFNIDQTSPSDAPYDYASSRRSGPSNPRPPFTPSEAEVEEQLGEKPWRCGDPRHYDIPKDEDGWQKCKEMVEKHDNYMCDAWRDEVEKLLIVVSLFSGIVTAFTTQSYQWLAEKPADSSARLLSFIATQMANSTNPIPPSLAIPEFTVTQAQIRINVLWFLSLLVSLTAVVLGLLCLQWLREFQRDNAALPHKEAVALRQMRYEGLTKWHVPGMISIIPRLLELSSILFHFGLLDLLWSLNTTVAACVSAVLGMVALAVTASAAFPALQDALTRNRHLRVPQCPYKSPQSWLIYRAGHWSFRYAFKFYSLMIRPFNQWVNLSSMPSDARILNSFHDNSWLAYDIRWRSLRDAKNLDWRGKPETIEDSDDVARGLHWINKTFTHRVEAIFSVYHSLADLDIFTAAATISEIYLKGMLKDYPTFSPDDYSTFKRLMDHQSSRNEMQNRDVIAAYYLKLYQNRHPVLKTGYVETVIRILNTQDMPTQFYGWFSQILWDLRLEPLPAPSVTTGAAAQLNTNEITIQTLLCVKFLITRDRLRTDDVVSTWILLRQLLTPLLRRLLTLPPSPPPNLQQSTHPIDSEPPNLDYIKLAGGLFEALEGWLSQGEETDRWERVTVCAEGMIRLFSSSIDVVALNAACPLQMAKAAVLVRALDGYMSGLGGAAAVLEKKSWEDGYSMERTCEVGEWDSLVSRFESIKGGNG